LKAESLLRQALSIEKATENRYGQMLALADLSYVKLLQEQLQVAMAFLNQAWSIAREVSGPEQQARLYWSQADLHLAMGDLEAAFNAYSEAISLMEGIRSQLGREGDRGSFITFERARIFGKMVLLLYRGIWAPR
jgi:tetratricopeptide (TPR) repeat protein